MKEKNYFDVIIVGGGPAGCTAALTLSKSNLKVALLEKASFPRDKVCGDAIPSLAFKTLHEIHPAWRDALFDLKENHFIQRSKIINDKKKSIEVEWVLPAYNARRIDFDWHLWKMVQQDTDTYGLENMAIKNVRRTPVGYEVQTHSGEIFSGKLLIAADGANSVLAKRLTGFQLNRQHHMAAVRWYMEEVNHMTAGTNLFFLFKKYLPGYFWIFPLGEGKANVGFGMLSSHIAKHKLNIKEILRTLIEEEPSLQAFFRTAKPIGKIKGFGLPIGSRLAILSGDHFMLSGDAGSLIDPLQGHGIDKAVVSGKLAAEQAIAAFQNQRFDAAFLKQYDRAVYRTFKSEFQRNYFLMKMLNKAPFLLTWASWLNQSAIMRYFFRKWS